MCVATKDLGAKRSNTQVLTDQKREYISEEDLPFQPQYRLGRAFGVVKGVQEIRFGGQAAPLHAHRADDSKGVA